MSNKTLTEKRRAIRPLLDERNSADAMAAYYAFYHDDSKTHLTTTPADAGRADGYVAVSRTGIDLFRPLVTLRLPDDLDAGKELIQTTLPSGTAVILHAPEPYLPLLQAFFEIQTVELLQLYVIDRSRFEPVINVLVTDSLAPNGLPRFVIRSQSQDNQVVASASLNWQSAYFGDIAVNTSATHRRQGWGRSVVSAMVNYLLANGRTPLYAISRDNSPSRELAQRVGFIYTGVQQVFIQAISRP